MKKRLIDDFRNEIMGEFIGQCQGNDFNRLTLLEIGETIDRIYRKYSTLPTVDAVEVVRCGECEYFCEPFCIRRDDETHRERINMLTVDFCSYGKRRQSP